MAFALSFKLNQKLLLSRPLTIRNVFENAMIAKDVATNQNCHIAVWDPIILLFALSLLAVINNNAQCYGGLCQDVTLFENFLPPNDVAVSMLPSNCETTIKLVNVYSAFNLLDYESKDQLVLWHREVWVEWGFGERLYV